jgi:hypothetical protein
MESLVAGYHKVLASPVLTDILMRQGKWVYDSGYPEFQVSGYKLRTNASPSAYGAQIARYLNEVQQGIDSGQFDLVVLSPADAFYMKRPRLITHYQLMDKHFLPMHWNGGGQWVEVWTRKPDSSRDSIR